jgi:hypothetical protein
MEFESANEIGDFSISIDDAQSAPTQLKPEKHLDSPITISLLERLQNIMALSQVDNKNVRPCQYDPRRTHAANRYLQRHPELAYSSIRSLVTQYSEALDYCKNPPVILEAKLYPELFSYSHTAPFRLQSDFKLSKRIFEHELNAYLRLYKDIIPLPKLNELKRKLTPCDFIGEEVVISSCRAQLWSDVVEDYRKYYHSRTKIVKRTYGPLRIIHCDGFLLLKSDTLEKWQLLTFEQLQMIQDCCLARHNIELALRFSFHNGTADLPSHVHAVYEWQENVLTTIGNDGYELVKAPEAIFKAWLNSLTNGDLLKYSSYQRTLDKMIEKEQKLHGSSRLMLELDTIVSNVTNIHDAAELFGLSKMSGHPSVFAHRSAKSVRTEAEPLGTIQPFAVRQMIRMFKHLTLSGYLSRHSSWPPLKCPPAYGTELRRHFVNQVTTLPLGSYPISDIDAIQFDKFVEYDYSEDYLKFLDDKAICPGAMELAKFWFGGHKNESRRLLQKILKVKEFDTVALVERLRLGNFTDDEFVVELTQKERELKTAARCFCKLPFAVRTFFTSTEYNLKEQFMSKYMPQQTMTMSSTETKQRMYNLVKNAKSKDRTLLEVDFSRWNLRWRENTVNPIALQLEDIFGLKGVFSQAHPFFTKATIVLTDKHTLPEFADASKPITQWKTSALVWRGTHLGGFEGIQQALWTTCTIAMMYWVLHDQNLSFNMAGQGDNQIFAITFDSSIKPIDEQLRTLLAVMEIRCKLLNHEVKPDECIDSRTVLTYSKDIYVEGNHVLYNLKFASRTFRRDEVDVPSLSTEVASVSAGSMACADSVYVTPLAVFWKTFHTIRLLSSRYRSPNYALERPHLAKLLSNESALTFAILLPGSLGGLPSMSWTRFFMKGEVDDLSWDIPAVRALAQSFRCLAWDLKLTLDAKYSPKRPNLSQLILDPHSIPIDRPKDMKRLIKEAVESKLLDHTENLWIREIFADTNDATGKLLIDVLTTAEPFYPEIMSDLYSLSPSGVRDALIARFTMTRTITAITGNPNFAFEIEASNARLLNFILMRHSNAVIMKGIPVLPNTSFQTCKELRKLWGPTVEHKNIGVYNPFDYRLIFSDNDKPMISASSRSTDIHLHTSLGPYAPNFGTKTKQKVSDHGFKIVSSSSTVVDLKKIILTYSELGGTIELARALSQVTSARSPWTVSQLSTVLPTAYGGTAAHRHAAINASAFSILGSRTVPTHLNFCSDLAGKLSGGEFDYPIAFQEYYLTLTNIFQVLTTCNVIDSNSSIGFCLDDDYEELSSNAVTVAPCPTLNWSVKPTNKLCYVSALQVDEIPVVPPISQVPHKSPDQLPASVLIYNRLLSKYCSKRRLFKTTSSVNLPIDLIDMKEFNHCPLNELIRGAGYFIQAMAIHAAVSEFTKNAPTFLHEYLFLLCQSSSALLTRMMLHPSFASSQFAIENNIVCLPGASGARDAAENLAGDLYNGVLLSIKAREMINHRVPLVLFADYAMTGAITSEIHATTLVALQSFDADKLLITSYQWMMLRSARYTIISQQRILNIAMNFRSTVDALSQQRSNASNSAIKMTKMIIVYCPLVPEEAIRSLRSLPTDVRSHCVTQLLPPLSMSWRSNSCTVITSDLDGSIKPNHICSDSDVESRYVDNFLSLMHRQIGRHSSALTIWLTVLIPLARTIKNNSILNIGVGHGAIASALIKNGASNVYGIDLRSSFPCISQREATYKPPEVLDTGRDSVFKWSRFVSVTGGDVIKNADLLEIAEPCNVWCIDIEQDLHTMDTLLHNIPANITLIIRVVTCREWAQFLYDALDGDLIFNTSALRTTHKQSYIIISRNFKMFNPNANFHRKIITSEPHWKSCVLKHQSYSLILFNDWLRRFGERIKVLSAHELTLVAARLRRRYMNANDSMLQNDLHIAYTTLNDVCEFYLDNTKITRLSITVASTDTRRLLARWLSNTNLDLSSIVNAVS